MDDSAREDYRWLMSDAATPSLARAMESFRLQENVVRLARLLRQDLPATRAAIVMEQAQLRLRAATKFHQADQMFFTRRGLEQSTGWDIARYKADQFSECQNVVDVCCGVGGDLIALQHRNDAVAGETTGVDADELTANFARHNLAVCAGDRFGKASVEFNTFEEIKPAALDQYDAMHVDPDRRGKAADFERTVHGSCFEPSLESIFDRTKNFGLVAIKVAPATPLGKSWPEHVEREWVGDRRECKQQLIWLGPQSARPGQRTATCVNRDGVATRFSVPESKARQRLPVADTIGAFIHEPHPAVLAAKIGHVLGRQFELRPLADDVAYLTGREIDSPLMQSFRVISVLPLHVKKVTQALKAMDIGPLEVKRRGVEQVAADQFAKIKLRGSQRATIVLTRLGRQRLVVIAQRTVGFASQEPVH